MQAKARKLSSSDGSEIRIIVASPGWQFIRERLEKTRDAKIEELLKPADPVQTAQLRGEIAGLKIALSVPAILISEAKGE